MKTAPQPISRRHLAAFTMMEMIIVITIVAVLTTMAFPAYNKLQRMASETVTVNGLKQIIAATMTWAADHGDKLPSPRYSGTEKNLPNYWKLESDGEEGLWLNGVIYAQIYIEEPEDAPAGDEPLTGVAVGASNIATAGKHLVSTVFESKASLRNNPEERDWFRHSYAMNANLMYDEITTLDGTEDPWLSEKALSKFEPTATMVYIDFIDSNIVMASDVTALEEVAESRYEGRLVMAAFLDGHVSKIHPSDLPTGDPETDREASLFWRGVLPQR